MSEKCYRIGEIKENIFKILKKEIALYSVDIYTIDLMTEHKVTSTVFYFRRMEDAEKFLEIVQSVHHISSFRYDFIDSTLEFNPFSEDMEGMK